MFFQIHYVKQNIKILPIKRLNTPSIEVVPSSALSHIALGHISFFQSSVVFNRDMWDPYVLVPIHPTPHH